MGILFKGIKKIIYPVAMAAAFFACTISAFASDSGTGFWGTAPTVGNAFNILPANLVTINLDGGTYNGGSLTSTDTDNGWFISKNDYDEYSISVQKGKSAPALSKAPVYSGDDYDEWDFMGWVDGDGNIFEFDNDDYPVTDNIVLYAVYLGSTLNDEEIDYGSSTAVLYGLTRNIADTYTVTPSAESLKDADGESTDRAVATVSSASWDKNSLSGSATVTGTMAGTATISVTAYVSGNTQAANEHGLTVDRIANTVTITYLQDGEDEAVEISDGSLVDYYGTGTYTVAYYGDGTVTAESYGDGITVTKTSDDENDPNSTESTATFLVENTDPTAKATITFSVGTGTNYNAVDNMEDDISVTSYLVTIEMNSGTPTADDDGTYGETGYGEDTWTYSSSAGTLTCYVPYDNDGVMTPAEDPERTDITVFFMGWKVYSKDHEYTNNELLTDSIDYYLTDEYDYVFGTEVDSDIIVYATWTIDTLLKTGEEINEIFKNLVTVYTTKTVDCYYNSSTLEDTITFRSLNVTSVEYSLDVPSSGYQQIELIGIPVYTWYNYDSSSGEGTIYLNYDKEDGSTVYMNPDMSGLFKGSGSVSDEGYNNDTDFAIEGKPWAQYLDSGDSFENVRSVNIFADFDTSKVKDASYMFAMCKSLETFDLGNFETNSALENIEGMFWCCASLDGSNVADLDVSNVTNMDNAFSYCFNLTSLDVSKWDTSSCTTMEQTFKYDISLTELDISNWDVSNVENMRRTFDCMYNVEKLDVSGWKPGKCTVFDAMFGHCRTIETIDIDEWNVGEYVSDGETISFSNFFGNCWSLQAVTINGSYYEGDKISTLSSLFNACTSLETVTIIGLDTSNVTSFASMFSGDTALTTIYTDANWDFSSCTSSSNMFKDCTSLVGGNGTTYNSSQIDKTYARIDKSGSKGYFTYKSSVAASSLMLDQNY